MFASPIVAKACVLALKTFNTSIKSGMMRGVKGKVLNWHDDDEYDPLRGISGNHIHSSGLMDANGSNVGGGAFVKNINTEEEAMCVIQDGGEVIRDKDKDGKRVPHEYAFEPERRIFRDDEFGNAVIGVARMPPDGVAISGLAYSSHTAEPMGNGERFGFITRLSGPMAEQLLRGHADCERAVATGRPPRATPTYKGYLHLHLLRMRRPQEPAPRPAMFMTPDMLQLAAQLEMATVLEGQAAATPTRARAASRAEAAKKAADEAYKRSLWGKKEISRIEFLAAAKHTWNAGEFAKQLAKLQRRQASVAAPQMKAGERCATEERTRYLSNVAPDANLPASIPDSNSPPASVTRFATAVWQGREFDVRCMWGAVNSTSPMRLIGHVHKALDEASSLVESGQLTCAAAVLSTQIAPGFVEGLLTDVALNTQARSTPEELKQLRTFLAAQASDVSITTKEGAAVGKAEGKKKAKVDASTQRTLNLPSPLNGMEAGSIRAAKLLSQQKSLAPTCVLKLACSRAFYRTAAFERLVNDPAVVKAGGKTEAFAALGKWHVQHQVALAESDPTANLEEALTKSRYQVPDVKAAMSSLVAIPDVRKVLVEADEWRAAEQALVGKLDKAADFLCTKVVINALLHDRTITLADSSCTIGPGAKPVSTMST